MARRGQSEAVGLLVIVILLLFIGFVYLRFSLGDGGGSYATIRESLQAHGLLRALVQLDAKGESFPTMAATCASSAQDCTRLKELASTVFAAALRPDQDYYFVVLAEEKEAAALGKCTTGIASSIPFTWEGTFYETRLLLCKR